MMKIKLTLNIILFTILISGCVVHKRQIESHTVSNYGTYNDIRFKTSVDYYSNKPNLNFSKTIYYNNVGFEMFWLTPQPEHYRSNKRLLRKKKRFRIQFYSHNKKSHNNNFIKVD